MKSETGSFIGSSGVLYLGSPGQWAWGPFYLCPPRAAVAGMLSFTMWSGNLNSALCTSTELSSSPPFPTREPRIPAWLLRKMRTSPILLLAQVLCSPPIPSFPVLSTLLRFSLGDGTVAWWHIHFQLSCHLNLVPDQTMLHRIIDRVLQWYVGPQEAQESTNWAASVNMVWKLNEKFWKCDFNGYKQYYMCLEKSYLYRETEKVIKIFICI